MNCESSNQRAKAAVADEGSIICYHNPPPIIGTLGCSLFSRKHTAKYEENHWDSNLRLLGK